MTLWRGVPDFSRPLEINDLRLFPAADEANLFVYVPSRLETAEREAPLQGLDFSLEAVRGISPFLPPEPYGVLDFRLRPMPADMDAITKLQADNPEARVEPVLFERGWLHLNIVAAGGTASATGTNAAQPFASPIPLSSNGLETARCIRRLTREQLSLFKEALQNKLLTFTSCADMEVWGLAPRLSTILDIVPTDLYGRLQSLANEQALVSETALIDFWMQDAAALPITLLTEFDTADRPALARTLAAWTLADFGAYRPNADLFGGRVFELVDKAYSSTTERWHLDREKLVPMMVRIDFDPFDAARKLVDSGGLAAVYTETIVPSLATGAETLTIAANLPGNLIGVELLGVDLLAPPRPPERVQPLTASLLLKDTETRHSVNWRFAPNEAITYAYTTFTLIQTQSGIRRLAGPPKAHQGNYLLLDVADFPLTFIPITASGQLLDKAVIHGNCRYTDEEGNNARIEFFLNATLPQLTLTIAAKHAPEAVVGLEAQSPTEAVRLPMGDFPVRSIRLDLFHLREYGSHTIDIRVEFDSDDDIIVLDLLPEALSAQPDQATTLAFTPARPLRQWTYFAGQPFHAGYLYRYRSSSGDTHGQWSPALTPFSALNLKSSVLADRLPIAPSATATGE